MDIGYFTFGDPPPPTPSDEPVASIVGNVSTVGCWNLAYQPCTSRAVTLTCNFTENGKVSIDIRELVEMDKIDNVRSIYFYNDTEFPMQVDVTPISQRGVYRPMSFGYIPIFASNKESILLTGDTSFGVRRVILTNVVMPVTIAPIEDVT